MRLKKANVWLMLVLFMCALLPLNSQAEVEAPKKECHAYVVMDAGSGKVLFGQDADKRIYPASTAKVMTAIVCVENGDMSKKIKTDYDVVYGTTLGTYCLGIGANVTYSLKDLLAMSLISSAADATDSLAVGVFGSKQACVEAMNKKCQELGLTGTHFDNPVGSDIGAGYNETYATATEMAKIVRYAMTKPMIRDLVRRSSYTPSGKDITANTTNRFIRGTAWYSEDKYKVIGTKSGTTNAAGHVFIATAKDDKGHEVICAFFGNISTESTFVSIRKLFDYTFSQYEKGNLELTPANYDVRCAGYFGNIYTKYAPMNCFPGNMDGTFGRNRAITRAELGKMVRAINEIPDDPDITKFINGNVRGNVTVAKLASFVQELYPAHLSKEKVEAVLADCTHTENLTDEEKEAYAIFLKEKLNPDDYCKNASQIITRKQAVYICDALRKYHNLYVSTHSNMINAYDADGNLQIGANVPTLNSEWVYKLYSYHTQMEEERARIAAEKQAQKEAAEAATANTAAETTTAAPAAATQATEATTAAATTQATEVTTAAPAATTQATEATTAAPAATTQNTQATTAAPAGTSTTTQGQ